MNNNDIKGPDTLLQKFNEIDATIGRMKNDFNSSLGMWKENADSVANKPREWSDEQKAEFGQMIRDLHKGKIESIGDISHPIKTKGLVGTPLTTDAVTGSSVTGEQYIADIIKLGEERSHLRPLVKKVDMTDRVGNYPKEDAEPSFTYVSSDSSAMSEGTMTFATPEVLTAYTYAFWVSFTESLLEDSLINLGDYFREKTAGAWARKFDSELLEGSGSPTTGVINDTSVNTVLTSGNNFGSMDGNSLFEMVEGLDSDEKREGAYFIGHPTIYDYLWRLQDANGRYMFRDVLIMGTYGKLLGYPWISTSGLPSSSDSAADTPFFVLGAPRHLIFGDRISLEIKKYDQMESSMEHGEVVFRARCRMAFNVAIPSAFTVLKTAA